MRIILTCLFLLISALYAETQENAYYRGLVAEKNGDLAMAIDAYKKALTLPGPYTEEIRETLMDLESIANPWAFHFSGNLAFYNIHTKESYAAGSISESAQKLDGSTTISAEYETSSWIHEFGTTFAFDVFFGNENAKVIDDDKWQYSIGLDYTLSGNTFLMDVGADFNNSENDSWDIDFFGWLEKILLKDGAFRLGASLLAYGDTKGMMSYAVYGSVRNGSGRGLQISANLGTRFEADSSLQSAKWVGPSFKPAIAFKAKNGLGLKLNANAFYAIAVGGPNSDFKKIRKLYVDLTPRISWEAGAFEIYTGLEQSMRFYTRPKSYSNTYPETKFTTRITAGIGWNI